mgnify:CR=1 FL=1|jgi:hypothetical protein
MRTFEQLRKYIKENIPDPFKSKNGESPDFETELKKTKSKGTKTFKQKSLNLYKAGGPFIPEKEVSQKTGKTVKMEPKPQWGKPKSKNKAPDRTGLKKAIADVRASDKRLYDAGVGKKPSLVQQRKYTISRIKELSRQTTRQDAYNRAFGSGSGSTEGSAGASGSSKTVTPTKPQKSASATDFTNKINRANKNRKEFTGNKKSFQKFKKQADAASDKLVGQREVVRSSTGAKNVQQLRDINKKIRSTERISKGYALASQGKGNLKSPVVRSSDLKVVTDTTKKPSSFKIKGATGPKNMKDVDLPDFVKDKKAPRSRNPWTATTKMGNKVTMSSGRAYDKTAVPDAIKRGFKGSAGKRAVLGKGAKIVKAAAKKSPLGAIALGAAGLIGTYAAGKSLFGGKPKDTLTIKDFTKLNKMSGRSSKGITKKDGSEVRRDFFMTKKQKEDKVKRGEDIISTNRKVREKNFTNKLRSGEYRTP